MTPTRKTRIPPSLDIPVLTEVADEPATDLVPEPEDTASDTAPASPAVPLSQDQLTDLLAERIAALTDRLLRDASAEIHATLVNKVWEKLRDEIPSIVEEALKDQAKE